MKKKIIVTGLTCVFLMLTGICYSCAFSNKASSTTLISSGMQAGETKAVVTESLSEALTPSLTEVPDERSLGAEEVPYDQRKQKKDYIYAHICGAVEKPGVYRAEIGARLYEFLELAGGLTEAAAGDYINQAQPIADGQRVYIPNQKEIKELTLEEVLAGDYAVSNQEVSSTGAATSTESALININTANEEELMSISGIGKAKANSILAYREKNGKFNHIEELMNIPGIKEGLFQQISYMIVAK